MTCDGGEQEGEGAGIPPLLSWLLEILARMGKERWETRQASSEKYFHNFLTFLSILRSLDDIKGET